MWIVCRTNGSLERFCAVIADVELGSTAGEAILRFKLVTEFFRDPIEFFLEPIEFLLLPTLALRFSPELSEFSALSFIEGVLALLTLALDPLEALRSVLVGSGCSDRVLVVLIVGRERRWSTKDTGGYFLAEVDDVGDLY